MVGVFLETECLDNIITSDSGQVYSWPGGERRNYYMLCEQGVEKYGK